MNKVKFNYMPLDKQVSYINNLLEFDSLKEAASSIGVGTRTIKDRFKSEGYIYNQDLRKFIFDDNCITDVIIPEAEIAIGDADVLKANIIELAADYDEIKDMLEWYRSGAVSKGSIIEVVEGIKIQLPEDPNPSFRTSIRVNSKVYEMFTEFAKDNKEFTSKDLLSQALLDFISRHK